MHTAVLFSKAFFVRPGALRLAAVFLVLFAVLRAQSVRWEPAGGTLASGKFEEVALIFDNCTPKAEPQVPKVPGLTLVPRGSSQNISMVNFKMTKSVTYLFAARLEKKEKAVIPAFDVDTEQGKLTVASIVFEPGDNTVGQAGVSLESVANAKLVVGAPAVWAGQVFPLTYNLEVLRRYFHNLGSMPDWNPSPLVVEEWTKPERTEAKKGAEVVVNVFDRTRAYVKEPGVVTLNPATQYVNIQTGMGGGFFFNQPQLEQIVVTSDQPKIVVKPLPSPAPASFGGAVGQFKLVSNIVPTNAKVGEPITWTLELSGTGNWPDIGGLPERVASKAFQVIQPKAKRTMAENKLFDGTLSEDVVLMPTKAGTYTLGPVEFTYFDPASGSYKTEKSPSVTVTISEVPSEQPQQAGPGTQQENAGGKNDDSGDRKPQAAPGQPKPIPTDPLEGPQTAFVPLSGETLRLLCLLPFALLAGVWAYFATQRALDNDPNRSRRAAAKKMKATLLALAAAEPGKLRPLLQAWQREAAKLLGCGRAAPTAEFIASLARSPVGKKGRTPDYALWAELWKSADEVLYGVDGKLPSDWLARAKAVFAATPIPGFPFYKTLAPKNLLPWWFAAVLLAAFLLVPNQAFCGAVQSGPTPADGAQAYASGDFAVAAKAWETATLKNPTDWRARHNFGLALLQQGHHGAAVAELGAAFVQSAGDETVRRNLLVASEHAGFAPQVIGELAHNNPGSELARLLTPFGWQLVLAAAALLAAATLCVALWLGYGLRLRWAKQLLVSSLALSFVLAGLALYGLHRYGPAAERSAALVWQPATLRSIPTEVDSGQKTAALVPGQLAVVDRSFLGWEHVSFADGQSGWVRGDDLVYLWQ